MVLHFHGGNVGHNGWFFLEHLVRAGYRVLTPDRPGYLGTPIENGGSPEQQADLAAALLDTLGIERVAVVGHLGRRPWRHPVRGTTRRPRRRPRAAVGDLATDGSVGRPDGQRARSAGDDTPLPGRRLLPDPPVDDPLHGVVDAGPREDRDHLRQGRREAAHREDRGRPRAEASGPAARGRDGAGDAALRGRDERPEGPAGARASCRWSRSGLRRSSSAAGTTATSATTTRSTPTHASRARRSSPSSSSGTSSGGAMPTSPGTSSVGSRTSSPATCVAADRLRPALFPAMKDR